MFDERALRPLLDRALQGDQDAWTELVRQVEPLIRRAVRVHLAADDPLRRQFDSLDVCQSVLLQFLTRTRLGAIQWESPAMLFRLLQRLATHKFIDKKRAAEAQRRDHRATRGGDAARIVDPAGQVPDDVAATRELYQEACRRMTDRERRIAELWAAGHSFPAIGEQVGGTDGGPVQPNAVRMTLDRAFRRLARLMPPA